jgi:hypothetical protein
MKSHNTTHPNLLSSSLSFLFFFLLVSEFLPLATALGCYYPDGSSANQDTPCQDSKPQSTCCGQGYACLSNNICMATGAELQKANATVYVRGSCTDKNWRSSECPLFCINPNPPFLDAIDGGAGVRKCPGEKDMYYCVDKAAADCKAQKNVLIFQG